MKRVLEKELIAWKTAKDHLPLLLRGARQVGKSYLVEQFGKKYFNNLVTVDFERRPDLKRCFLTREPQDILKQLEVALQERVVPGQTLLFLDEIQECPDALVSLRYFRELMPDLHVIAAGSLMEFLLHSERYSFPVGRVEFLYLRPFSFIEFLIAVAPLVAERLESITFDSPLLPVEHEELLKWVRRYLFIGGMPSAIATYLSSQSLLECQRVHQRILQAYESDFGKYASHAQHQYLQMVFQRAPLLVSKLLKYTQIDREARSRELKPALELLNRAGLLQRAYATSASGLPLHAHMRDHRFKLLFLDVGLLQTACQVDAQEFWEKEVLQINAGMLAEQFVGQELLASDDPHQNRPLLFWEREEGGDAEVDYVISIGSQIIPIEVKAGLTGSLRSLHSFLSLKEATLGVRISEYPLMVQDHILSIPFYLVHAVYRLVMLAKKK